jgi:hypothetical protein
MLLRADLSARLPYGFSDADSDDLAGAARQGSHVPVGLGHQRLLLGHRRIVATSFGLSAVLLAAGGAYLLAIPVFFAVLLPLRQGGLRASESVPGAAHQPAA